MCLSEYNCLYFHYKLSFREENRASAAILKFSRNKRNTRVPLEHVALSTFCFRSFFSKNKNHERLLWEGHRNQDNLSCTVIYFIYLLSLITQVYVIRGN